MDDGAHLYVLRCSDGSYYVGTTRTALESRIAQHDAGFYPGYTLTRRPVKLVHSEWFERIADAVAAERRLKKWTRAKKEAYIRGEFDALRSLSRRRRPHPSRRPQERPPQDEDGA